MPKPPIEQLLDTILTNHGSAYRFKAKAEAAPYEWCSWLCVPVPGYLEIGGPLPVRHIEWVEVNPVVTTSRGRLVPPQVDDYTDLLKGQLTAAGLSFIVTDDGYIRVSIK